MNNFGQMHIKSSNETFDSSLYVNVNDSGVSTNESIAFNVNGEIISFNSLELKYLKKMVTEYINQKHPEELL